MPSFDSATNTYTFKIRPGLKWSDGTPIDANTFAYSINRSLNPCTGSVVTYYMFPIKDAPAFSTETCGSDGTTIAGKIQSLIGDSITVPDSQTLVIKLSAPAPYFLEALCYPTDIRPAGAADRAVWHQGLDQSSDRRTAASAATCTRSRSGTIKGNLDLVRNASLLGHRAQAATRSTSRSTRPLSAEYADYLDGKSGSGCRTSGSVQTVQGSAPTSMKCHSWLSATTSRTGPRHPSTTSASARPSIWRSTRRCWPIRSTRDRSSPPTISCRRGCMAMIPVWSDRTAPRA